MTRPLLRIAPYLLSATAGAGLWTLTHRENAHAPLSAATEIPLKSSTREKIEGRLQEFKKVPERTWVVNPRSPREQGMEEISRQKDALVESEKRLKELRAVADTFRSVENLRGALLEALIEGNADTGVIKAIFLEWYRRDPSAAFAELAKLRDWQSWVLESDMAPVFTGEDVIAQLAHPERSAEFKGGLVTEYARWLGANDNLADLLRVHQSIDPEHRQDLLSYFTSSWVPDDGKEAARFIMEAADTEFRRGLLGRLCREAKGEGRMWTEDFSTALLGRNLGDCEDLRAGMTHMSELAAARPPVTEAPPRPMASLGETGDMTVRDIEKHLEKSLNGEKDYLELFARHEIDAASLFQEMRGEDRYREEFAAALFRKLAPHDPQAAKEWAKSELSEDRLALESTKMVTASKDPRAARLGYLMAHLPTRYPGEEEADYNVDVLKLDFQDWSRIAPEEAGKVIPSIPSHSVLKDGPPPDPTKEGS